MAEAAKQLPRMDADAFLLWGERQPSWPRYELIDGEVLAQVNERSAHALLKGQVARQLFNAVARAGVACTVYPDGMSAQIDTGSVFGPDCMVRCGPALPGDAVVVPDPVIVVEILSPSTAARDLTFKLEGYLRIPSLRHYLILRTDRPTLIHHARAGDGSIATRIVTREAVHLDPPGMTLDEWWPVDES